LKAWRLTHSRWQKTAFSGEGAALYPGRWNKAGERMVYLGSSLALAVLETLVHLEVDAVETAFTAIEVSLPDDEIRRVEKLKKDWQSDLEYSRDLGSKWLNANASLVLLVPSAIVTVEMNVLLNPASPKIKQLKEVQAFAFMWDNRLF
jgi:RES domain-containing protein